MSFQLFRRPGSVIFLDDDAEYLDMLAMVLPRHWNLRMFVRPAKCLHFLHRETRQWEADHWAQQALVEQWRQGKPLIPQILQYWSQAVERFAMTQICVIDFSMPGMDGLQVLSELREWPGARVLLTGQADERVAVGAFNRGLIDQYIPKQAPDSSPRLIDALDSLVDRPHTRHEPTWRATLSPEQNLLLRDTEIQKALGVWMSHHWIEHIVIGDPFGVLGANASGQVSWLQLETPDGLAAMAELAELEGVEPEGLAAIRNGQKLISLELHQALGHAGACQLEPAFPLDNNGKLLGALFTVPASDLAAPVASYANWLAQYGTRKVAD